MSKLNFRNHKEKSIDLIIEPMAEEFELKKGQNALIKLIKINSTHSDEIVVEYHDDCIIIFEARQFKMEVFIEDTMVYKTDLY